MDEQVALSVEPMTDKQYKGCFHGFDELSGLPEFDTYKIEGSVSPRKEEKFATDKHPLENSEDIFKICFSFIKRFVREKTSRLKILTELNVFTATQCTSSRLKSPETRCLTRK